MSKWGKWSRLSAIVLVVVMSVSLLAACGGKDTDSGEGKERVLRIAYSAGYNKDYGDWLRTQFTEIFEWVNPNIKVEFVENIDSNYYGRYSNHDSPEGEKKQKTPMELLKEELDGATPPDVIIMEYADMGELVREGRLTSLEPLMQKSKINTDEFVPSVVEALKSQSEDGKLYGLAPLFQSSVLAYNKKLFTDASLAFPTDGMTWDEMFNLARQVARGEGKDRKYGFTFSNYKYNDLFYDSSVYTSPLNLQIWDEKGEKMMVNSPDWIKSWKTIIDLKNEKIFPEPIDWSQPREEPMNQFDSNSLLSGNVAMSIVNYWDLNEIINANRNAANFENFTAVDWDVVSVPYHESAPNVGGYVYLNGIMGVTSNAGNSEDAWKFIEFIMSEKWAQQKAKSVQQMVTWKKYNEPREGLDYNLEAFYRNTPAINNMDYNQLWRTKPDIGQAQWIGQQKFQEVVNGDKTVEEALKEWETEGDAILQKLMENNGRIDPNYGEPGMGISSEKLRVMEAAGEDISQYISTDAITEEIDSDTTVEAEAVE